MPSKKKTPPKKTVMAPFAPGKEYEQIVASVYRQVAGDGTVTENEKIQGKSGKPRQIDVAVRREVDGQPELTVIECKDYATRVGIGRVDELIGKIQHVKATYGILASDSGFTEDAIIRTDDDPRITLVSVHDSKNSKLRSKLVLAHKVTYSNLKFPYSINVQMNLFESPPPTVLTLPVGTVSNIPKRRLKVSEATGLCKPRIIRTINIDDPEVRKEMITVLRAKGIDAIRQFHLWTKEDHVHKLETGTHKYSTVLEETDERRVVLECNFEKTLRTFVNENIPAKGAGIFNHVNRKLVAGELEGVTFVEDEIVKNWKEVPNDYPWPDGKNCYSRVSSYPLEMAEFIVENLIKELENRP